VVDVAAVAEFATAETTVAGMAAAAGRTKATAMVAGVRMVVETFERGRAEDAMAVEDAMAAEDTMAAEIVEVEFLRAQTTEAAK